MLYRSELREPSEVVEAFSSAECEFYHESIGGRIEQDGSFKGTRWQTQGIETMAESEPKLQSTPSEPSAEDAARIKALVAELICRAPRAQDQAEQ